MARRKIYGTAFYEGISNEMITLDAATVTCYQAGTMTPIDMYENQSGGASVPSVSTLSNGYYSFWIEYVEPVKVRIEKPTYDLIERDWITIGHGTEASINDHADVDASSPTNKQVLQYNVGTGKFEATTIAPSAGNFDLVIDIDTAVDPEADFVTALQSTTITSIAVKGSPGSKLYFNSASSDYQIGIVNVVDKYIWFDSGVYIHIDWATGTVPIFPNEPQGFLSFQPAAGISDYRWVFDNVVFVLDGSAVTQGLFSFGLALGGSYPWLDTMLFNSCIFEIDTATMFLEANPSGTDTIRELKFTDCLFSNWNNLTITNTYDDSKGVDHILSVNSTFKACTDTGATDWWKKLNESYEKVVGNILPSPQTGPKAGLYSRLDADTLDGMHASDIIPTALTVKEVDGSPSVSDVTILEFDQSTGLTVTDEGSGTARVSSSGGGSSAFDTYVMNPGDGQTEFDAIVSAIGGSGTAKITFMPGYYYLPTKGNGTDYDFGSAIIHIEGYGKASNLGMSGSTYTGSFIKSTNRISISGMSLNSGTRKTYFFDGNADCSMTDCYISGSIKFLGYYSHFSNCVLGTGSTILLGNNGSITGLYSTGGHITAGSNSYVQVDGEVNIVNIGSYSTLCHNGSITPSTGSITLGYSCVYRPGFVDLELQTSAARIMLNDGCSIEGGIISALISTGQSDMSIIQTNGSATSIIKIDGTKFIYRLESHWDTGGSNEARIIKYAGSDMIYMGDCTVKFEGNGYDIIDNNSKLRMQDITYANLFLNGLTFEFDRGIGSPLTYTGTGHQSWFQAARFVGCHLVGYQADFVTIINTATTAQISGSKIIGNVIIAPQTQVTGSYIDGNISVFAGGTDTIVVGNHVTGTIAVGVEVKANNTN